MDAANEGEILQFKQFLDDFCTRHSGEVKKHDQLPFRLITFRLTKDEIEGECSSWVVEYLQNLNNAPPLLVAAIVRETLRIVQDTDVSPFIEQRSLEEGEEPCVELNANGFARFIFSTVHEICARWRDNLPSIQLPSRIPQFSFHAIRNTRRKMEDKHVIIPDMHAFFGDKVKADKPRSFYAVYDGHGGVDASYYAAAHLHYIALKEPNIFESSSAALVNAFTKTDEAFISKAAREGLRSGSTGVVALVESDVIHVSWLGDSQAVLMRDGQAVSIMEPHSPEREDEKKRIEQMGGCVVWFGAWRVNGSLSVSRSIGDPEYKPYVCNEADSITIPREGTEECIILACDGLWDTVTKEEACAVVKDCILPGQDRSQIASKLVTMAKENGSGDNISVLVVFLDPDHGKSKNSNPGEGEKTVDSVEGKEMGEPNVNGEVPEEDKDDAKDPEERSIVGTKDVDGSTKVPSHLEQEQKLNQTNSQLDSSSHKRNSADMVRLIHSVNDVCISDENTEIKSMKIFRSLSKPQNSYLHSNSLKQKTINSKESGKVTGKGLSRSKSEPPKKKVFKEEQTKENTVELEIVPRSRKTVTKGLPMKHNSFPSTLKTRRSNSLTRKPQVDVILTSKSKWKRKTFPKQNKGD